MFNVVIVSPSVLSDIKPEISEKLLNGCERGRDFFIPDVLMVAFPGFVVVTQDTDAINNVGQPIFVIVIAGSHCRINFPYNQLSPCIAGEGHNFPHNCFGWHKLNIVFVCGVANSSNTIGVLSRKSTLDHLNHWRYSDPAPYKTGVGRGNPKLTKATPDAVSVFFVVRYTRHSMTWCSQRLKLIPLVVKANYHAAHNGGMCAYRAGLAPSTDTRNHTSRHQRMVTLAGLPKGRPVPFVPGISTPVNVTALFERGNSGGDSLTRTKEAVTMATVPDQNPLFVCYFKNRLPVRVAGLYIPVAGVNPPTRFDSLITVAGSRDISDMRFFCTRNTILTRLMAGRNGGALAFAGSYSTSLSTLLRPATMFDSVMARFYKTTVGAANMAISARPQGRTSSHLKSVNKLNKPLFVWRFVSVRNSAYFTATAASEREARLQLPAVRLVFAARIRLEVCHA
ncbi:host cell division inhibitor Icd-like protein [Salmonella enterica subsp. enterica serovar Rubislaw]|nr:host cell division inhibitor Icd-like protein [Salmonella enterica subsp. enterica serovar Rubislaw]